MSAILTQAAPEASPGQTVLEGPARVGSERRWRLALADGRRAVLSQLLPELAREESLRRRYVHDAERMRDLDVPGVAEILAIGPEPDPRAPGAEPPWRLRLDPAGETLEAWLRARAPAPVDEALDLAARLADAMHQVHRRGAVLRNLQPAEVVLGEDGALWLTDVGLARTDILSTRTASSLVLEGSPYVSPEHLRRTTIDPRSDAYTLGVILWRALTGELPFGDGPAILRDDAALPPLRELRSGLPEGLDGLLAACLAAEPEDRPESLFDVAEALRGRPSSSSSSGRVALVPVVCQACGSTLRPGLRLCLTCGKAAIQFRGAASEDERYVLDLVKARDDDAFHRRLREVLSVVAEGPLPPLNFLVGDARWYSKEEKEAVIHLPARLFADLDEASAAELRRRLAGEGIDVRVRSLGGMKRRRRRGIRMLVAGACTFVAGFAAIPVSGALTVALLLGGAALGMAGGIVRGTAGRTDLPTLLGLRDAPAALPAADGLIARLAALLHADTPADVRGVVAELALLVQRLTDHRAEFLGDTTELDLVTRPVEPLIGLVETQVHALAAIDRELAGLDEGAMVRALAASQARGEARELREPILAGLDRLRALEDQRCAHLARLLEAASLLRRAVELGLETQDPDAAHERQIRMALETLG